MMETASEKNPNPEGRLRAPVGVAVLEDNERLLRLITRTFEMQKEPYTYKVYGSKNPGDIYDLLTGRTREPMPDLAILDVVLKGTPPEEKEMFKNGLEVALAAKEVRGKTLDVIVISGARIGEALKIAEVSKGLPYVTLAWEKPEIIGEWIKSAGVKTWEVKGSLEELIRMSNDLVSKRELMRPEYPRPYILVGEKGAGKTSVGRSLAMHMSYVYAVSPDTTRPPERPSDALDMREELFYHRNREHITEGQHLGRKHLTNEEFRKQVTETKNPLIWIGEGPALTKDGYLALNNSDLKGRDFYMLDLDDLADKLMQGHDVVITIRTISAVEKLTEFFNKKLKVKSHVIHLRSGPITRERRMRQEGRPVKENSAVLKEEIKEEIIAEKKCGELADTVIESDLAFKDTLLEEKERRQDAIDRNFLRISDLITYLRKTPYGVSSAEMHSGYVKSVELALCKQGLEVGAIIEIPIETRRRYHAESSKNDADSLSLVKRISSATVTRVEQRKGVKRVRIKPTERALELEASRPWGPVLKDLTESYLRGLGFHTSQTKDIFPPLERFSANLEHELVYCTTDKPVRPDKSRMPYKLELIFV